MRITVTSIPVDDQDKALSFYVDIMGFQKARDIPMGKYRWLTVVSPERPEGVQLSLAPDEHPAVRAYRNALKRDGIPIASFSVDDIKQEYERLCAAGVEFAQKPISKGPVTNAMLEDPCGNLIQIVQLS